MPRSEEGGEGDSGGGLSNRDAVSYPRVALHSE